MSAGFLPRIGAILSAPRRLARRDLEAQDHKGGDDLFVLAALALLVQGATPVVRGVRALFAGHTHTAARSVLELMRPAALLTVTWLVTTLVLWAFTARQARRAPAELGARVTSAFVIVSLVLAPFVSLVDPGPLHYALERLPWLAAALVFGMVLREAIDDPHERATAWSAASRGTASPLGRGGSQKAFGIGAALVVAMATSALFVVGRAAETAAVEPSPQRIGSMAPPVSAPLLGGARLELDSLRGRRVVLSFWATWCSPCMKELPVIEQAYRARGPDAPLVYAVNVDEPGAEREGAVRAVQQRFGLTVPIALDDGAAASAYAVQSIPTLVRVDGNGKVEQVFDRPLDQPELKDVMK